MMHNACFQVDGNDNCLPGQIGLIIKTGWAKNNSLLRYVLAFWTSFTRFRAADVGVAKSKGEEEEIDSDDEEPK